MGVLIACELLIRGCSVCMWDNDASRCGSVFTRLKSMLMNSTGCDIDGVSIDLLMQRLSTASGLEELACRGCDVILEAVSEDLQIKRQVIGSMFDALKANAVLPEQVIICSNTISISIEHIVDGLDEMYSCRFMGLRFLYPVIHIDDAEVTTHSYNTHCVIHKVMLIMRSMQFKPALRDRLSGRRLSKAGN